MVENTKLARFRRELRNPSMATVLLIVLAVAAIPLILLVPSWVSTTKGSIKSRSDAESLRDASLLSSSVIVPSQITPWMLNQISRMEAADSPFDWNYTAFTAGPCAASNLGQLPPGQYSVAIRTSCTQLDLIQADYAGDCKTVAECAIPAEAYKRLASARSELLEAFSNAGFVLPYSDQEQQTGP
jgi:hypothetical protein